MAAYRITRDLNTAPVRGLNSNLECGRACIVVPKFQ